MRQRSRAFIVADASSPNDRIIFINAGMCSLHTGISPGLAGYFGSKLESRENGLTNILCLPWSVKWFLRSALLDIAMGDTGVRRSIVGNITNQFPGIYTNENIAFVGTHQHSGVGGYLENLLPQVTSLGYVKQSADAIVTGTVLAVQRAHANLAPGRLSLGNTTILDANINRSPTAYLQNPASERTRYKFDQDKDMTLLRFDDNNGNARGFLSFFAVHGTSLYEART